MRLTLSLAAMALIMVALAWPASALPSRADPSRLLDSMRADYLEDELTGRRIADFRMRLVTTGDDTGLRLHIAATGRAVDPVPRFLHAWVRDEARRILDGK